MAEAYETLKKACCSQEWKWMEPADPKLLKSEKAVLVFTDHIIFRVMIDTCRSEEDFTSHMQWIGRQAKAQHGRKQFERGFYPKVYAINSVRKAYEVFEEWKMIEQNATEKEPQSQAEAKSAKQECLKMMELVFGKEQTKIFCRLSMWKILWQSAIEGGYEEDLQEEAKYLFEIKSRSEALPDGLKTI